MCFVLSKEMRHINSKRYYLKSINIYGNDIKSPGDFSFVLKLPTQNISHSLHKRVTALFLFIYVSWKWNKLTSQ